jgi:hypothetical protein
LFENQEKVLSRFAGQVCLGIQVVNFAVIDFEEE